MRNDKIQPLVKKLNDGDVKGVIKTCKRLLKNDPFSISLLNIYAVALTQSGEKRLAKRLFNKAKKIDPQNAITSLNLGNLHFVSGEFSDAAKEYCLAIDLKPNYARAFNNLGTAQQKLNLFDEAEESFLRAIRLNSDYIEAYYNLAVNFRMQNKLKKARQTYEKILSLNPNHISALNNFALILQETGEVQHSIKTLKKAITNAPNDNRAFFNLCEIYEKSNQITEFEKLLATIKNTEIAGVEDALFYRGLLKFRQQSTGEALEILKIVDEKKLSKSRLRSFYHLKAKCYDEVGDFDAAYDNFKLMNDEHGLSKKINDLQNNPYRSFIVERSAEIQNQSFKPNAACQDVMLNPVFLIGFPRSGTTLVDTILRSHSQISVIEEVPLITDIAKEILEEQSIVEMENLSPSEIQNARRQYMDAARDLQPTLGEDILVDKLPLNIVEIPFIKVLFPQSKFIFVLRHPLDSILSNFMQNFKLNEAMSNFLKLSHAADFYCEVMTLFESCQKMYELDVHQIRYESLILNIEAEVTPMLEFLGLEWEPTILNFNETALNRPEIKTPSYSQVTKPLYSNAIYRWQNYKGHIFPECENALPWIEKFGYEKVDI